MRLCVAGRPLSRIIAAVLVMALPVQAGAQSMQADQELEDLIPDSAIGNADAWATDTDAARTGAPPATVLDEIERDSAMPDIPGMTIP
ncbi:MAG: hypothetical protein VW935_19200, partial [Novosphingobium sp.]